MKVYSTEEKELIMELALKWAGNPNILVAVKAFGLKATAQVLIQLKEFIGPRSRFIFVTDIQIYFVINQSIHVPK